MPKKKPPAKKSPAKTGDKKPKGHKCPPPTLKEARRIVAEAEGKSAKPSAKPAGKLPPMPK